MSYLAVGILAGLAAVERKGFLQAMLSRPIAIAPLAGWALGDVLPAYAIAALTATGGLLIIGIALRLLRVKQVPVGDLLPALIAAPALAWLAATLL